MSECGVRSAVCGVRNQRCVYGGTALASCGDAGIFIAVQSKKDMRKELALLKSQLREVVRENVMRHEDLMGEMDTWEGLRREFDRNHKKKPS